MQKWTRRYSMIRPMKNNNQNDMGENPWDYRGSCCRCGCQGSFLWREGIWTGIWVEEGVKLTTGGVRTPCTGSWKCGSSKVRMRLVYRRNSKKNQECVWLACAEGGREGWGPDHMMPCRVPWGVCIFDEHIGKLFKELWTRVWCNLICILKNEYGGEETGGWENAKMGMESSGRGSFSDLGKRWELKSWRWRDDLIWNVIWNCNEQDSDGYVEGAGWGKKEWRSSLRFGV